MSHSKRYKLSKQNKKALSAKKSAPILQDLGGLWANGTPFSFYKKNHIGVLIKRVSN